MKNADSGAFRQVALNTLAQSGTATTPNPVAILQGKGAEMGGAKAAKSRSKRKFIGQAVALMLVEVARRKGDEDMVKACWNSYHCQSRIFTHEGRIYGRYCKNRFCPLCCSIRKADFINRYLPVLKCWEDPHFVTLTVKACPAKNLPKLIEAMMRVMRKIIARHRKRHQRGTENAFLGIRSQECNFNPQKRRYNPHFHLVVPDMQTARTLIRDWLELVKNGYSTKAAQHYRPVGKLDADLIETIKYGSKIFTDPDRNKSLNAAVNPKIYAAALYNIYAAMKGHRIFDRFGFDLPPANREKVPARVTQDFEEWQYLPELRDWHSVDSELMLVSCGLPTDLVDLVKNVNYELD